MQQANKRLVWSDLKIVDIDVIITFELIPEGGGGVEENVEG